MLVYYTGSAICSLFSRANNRSRLRFVAVIEGADATERGLLRLCSR